MLACFWMLANFVKLLAFLFFNVGMYFKKCWHFFKVVFFLNRSDAFCNVETRSFCRVGYVPLWRAIQGHKRALISTANAHDYVHTAWTKDSSSISDLNDVYHCALFEVYGLAPDHDAACQLKLTWRYLTSKCLWYLLANSNCTKVSIWKSSIQLDQMKSFEQMIYRNWLVEF